MRVLRSLLVAAALGIVAMPAIGTGARAEGGTSSDGELRRQGIPAPHLGYGGGGRYYGRPGYYGGNPYYYRNGRRYPRGYYRRHRRFHF